jgi:hypothetical protein
MTIRLSYLITFLTLATACGGSQQKHSSTEAVTDIVSMQARSDGNFDVVCRDGRREIATPDDIRSDRVCESGTSPSGSLICVARDNDNRDPWVFAVFTDSGNIAKIAGVSFTTKAACDQALTDSRDFGSSTVVCVARDNDGRDPWQRVSINSAGQVQRHSTLFQTYAACATSLTQGRAIGEGLVSCTARDNDNRDPWIFTILSTKGEGRIVAISFTAVTACQQALADGRLNRLTLLVCVARDNDNRDPWIIASLKSDGTATRNTSTTFGTYQQCQQTLGRP